jgi:tRNA threonylcarbamoyladenosine biosynthesis protein TsaE
MSGAHRADPGTRVDQPVVTARGVVPTAAAMRELGARLAAELHAGDLVVLTGDLGAGKTTLTQGIGAQLRVAGEVTSPTFVIARAHPSPAGRPTLVHVDAYRLDTLAEVDDLDLDASPARSITVVEWGEGLVEGLAADRLEVRLRRRQGAAGPDDPQVEGDEPRSAVMHGYGERWAGIRLPLGR